MSKIMRILTLGGSYACPLTVQGRLQRVHAISGTVAVVGGSFNVTNGGRALFYNAGTWLDHSYGSGGFRSRGLFVDNISAVWHCTEGNIDKWNSSSWSAETSISTPSFFAEMIGVSPSELYVTVSDGGGAPTLGRARYRTSTGGGTWSSDVTLSLDASFWYFLQRAAACGTDGTNPSMLWSIADKNDPVSGDEAWSIIDMLGGSELLTPAYPAQPWDVTAPSPTCAYAVGWDNTYAPTIWEWDGSSWTTFGTLPTFADPTAYPWFNVCAALAPDDLWVAGNYYLNGGVLGVLLMLHWNGSAWTQYTLPGFYGSDSYQVYITDLHAVAADDVWAVGIGCDTGTVIGSRTMIFHWNGSSWAEVQIPVGMPT